MAYYQILKFSNSFQTFLLKLLKTFSCPRGKVSMGVLLFVSSNSVQLFFKAFTHLSQNLYWKFVSWLIHKTRIFISSQRRFSIQFAEKPTYIFDLKNAILRWQIYVCFATVIWVDLLSARFTPLFLSFDRSLKLIWIIFVGVQNYLGLNVFVFAV